MSARRSTATAVITVAGAVLLAACGSTAPSGDTRPSAEQTSTSTAVPLPVPTQDRLLGSWSVVALPLQKEAVDKRRAVDIALVDGTLTAVTDDGCNRKTGPLTVSPEGRVQLGGLLSTQVLCRPRPDQRHIEALYAARTVGLDDRSGLDQLVLRDATERIVLVLQRIPPLSMGALLGTWKVESLGDGSAPRRPLAVDFQLVGESGSVVTGDGCSSATSAVLLSDQYGIRFGAPTIITRPCTGSRDDRLVRSLTQVRSARTDLTGDPQRITLLTRDGNPVAVLSRAG